mgnify:CR=1 FL=1
MKKSLKIILIVLGAILLLLVLVSLLSGPIAKSYVNKNGETLIGRKVQVEHVGLNIFTGHVNIRQLTVYEENATDAFAGFDTLDVSLKLLRLMGKEVYVKHVTLAGLDVKVLQHDTVFNFSSMLDHFGSGETETEKDTTPSDWIINLHNIRLSDGTVYYADVTRGSHWDLNDLNLIVPDFCIGGTANTGAGLTVSLADGGQLTANGEYNAISNDFKATLNLENFVLEQVRPYVSGVAKIGEIKGRMGIDATVTGNLSNIMDMVIAATANIDDVDVIDKRDHSVASLAHLTVELNKLVPGKSLYDIAKVELNGLTARYELFADSSNTLSRLLVATETETAETAEPATAQDTTSAATEPMHLHLGHLAMNDINVTYADHTMPDDFEFPITNLRIEADDITTNGNNSAKVFANLPHGGVAIINWSGNIGDWKSYQSLRLNIKNLHLADLSPYMVAYLGQPFTDGIFSFTSYNTIHNSQLDGKNHIDIYKPTVGDRRKEVKDAKKLPLKAALYVLKDKNDKVLLDVPVTGNIDNPEFNYMKLVWKTLGNLLVKVATSPFRALAGNQGGDELFIAVSPEETDFTSEQYYTIDRVAEMAKMDEDIILNLELQSRPTEDSTIVRNHERRNKILMRHLTQEGIPEAQITITAAEPSEEVKKEGYAVSTTLKETPETSEEVEP